MNKDKRYKILSIFFKHNPEPQMELIFSSDFELLLSVMLSAKSTDSAVNTVTKRLFQIANTPENILKLGIENLKDYIKTIGLYNTKAINIIKTAFIIMDQYQGKIPKHRAMLESLPGVGRKTANIILNVLFKKKILPLIHMYLEYLIALILLLVKMCMKLKKN